MTTWMIGGIAFLVLLLALAGFVVAHDHSITMAERAKNEAQNQDNGSWSYYAGTWPTGRWVGL